jgi:internalin A
LKFVEAVAMSYVNLSSTHVGDDDLKNLENLDDVDVLDLSSTEVSDAGLGHLKRLTRLQMLVLSGTHVTPAGIDELRHALPGLAIVFSS